MTLIKVLTWRVIAFLVIYIVIVAQTGDWSAAFHGSVISQGAKVFLHYGFERAWCALVPPTPQRLGDTV